MNAQFNNSDESGSGGIDTNKYQAMLKEAWKLEAQRQLQQEQNFWHRFDLPKRKPHRQYLKATKSVDVTMPRDIESDSTVDISYVPTKLIYPQQQTTDAIPYDISLQATRIEPFDARTVLAEMECTPLPETTPRTPRITIQLEGEEPQVLRLIKDVVSAQEMVETAIEQFYQRYETLPARIKVSPSTLLRMDGKRYWTSGNQTYYQSFHHDSFLVEVDATLDHMTVQCEEAELAN